MKFDNRVIGRWFESFVAWEKGGRGWTLWDYAVELEPPFSPIPKVAAASPVLAKDDARVRGGIAGFLNRRGRVEAATPTAPDKEPRLIVVSPQPPPFYRSNVVTEVKVVLPPDLAVTPAVGEQFVQSLSSVRTPVSFEVIAGPAEISLQFACDGEQQEYVCEQLKAYFPPIALFKRTGSLASEFARTRACVAVDFGLSRSFLQPLRSFRSFNPDPLGGIINSMVQLGRDEATVFQVMALPVRPRWIDEIRGIDQRWMKAYDTDAFSGVKEKISSSFFAVTIRVMVGADTSQRCLNILKQIGSGFGQIVGAGTNELIALDNAQYPDNNHRLAVLNRTSYRSGMLLNSAELTSVMHLPDASIRIPRLIRNARVTKAVPALAVGNRLVLGENVHEGKSTTVSLSQEQRTRHIHVLGSTGSGKSSLLLTMILQGIAAGEGVCVIDAHGGLIDAVCSRIPEQRLDDTILFDASDPRPIGFNILQANSEVEKTLIASDLVAAFRRMSTSFGDVMATVLSNTILAILESDRGGTLIDVKRLLVEKDFRAEFLTSVQDENVRYYWQHEFPLISGRPQASILIRLDTFLRQKLIRNIVCQKENKLNFREVMDNKKILLIKLSQGAIGIENCHLLGTLLVSKIHQIALSRQETTERPFWAVYIDEFHNFVVPSMEAILSGIRKFNIGLALAHQDYRQLISRSPDVAASVMSNCYTRICFRLGDADAERFATGFAKFDASALQNLGIGEAIARVERADFDFNMKTLDVPTVDPSIAGQNLARIIESSRDKYSASSAELDAMIRRSFGETRPAAPANATGTDVPTRSRTKIPADEPRELATKDSSTKSEHQYLQSMVKRIAEKYEYIATVEKEVFGGAGRVDVALENGSVRIACEVAVTNTVSYEISNIQKCLSSGFDKVVVISPSRKHLQEIRQGSEEVLTLDQISRVHFIEPENLHLFLESLHYLPAATGESKPGKVKGYKVETSFGDLSELEVADRRNQIADLLDAKEGGQGD